MELEFSRKILEKYSDIKFNENPASGSQVPCGRTVGHIDTTKLTVDFRVFVNTPKNACCLYKINFNIILSYEGWNFNSGNYLFTTDTK